MSKGRKPNILIIGNPIVNESSEMFLEKFLYILHPLANDIHVISADKPPSFDNVSWNCVNYRASTVFQKVTGFFYSQVVVAVKSLLFINNFDVVIVLPVAMFLTLIILKLFNKKIILFAAQKLPNYTILQIISNMSLFCSDLIIVESFNVIKDLNLSKYKQKIIIGNIFVDTSFFKPEVHVNKRKNIVGYIGGLNKRKGTDNLISAIEIIHEKKVDVKFIIGGSGEYSYILKNMTNSSLTFKGLVPQKDLPQYLNSMKLLILPSNSEGVPNIILEAMACGTPVLATKVGGIIDIIVENETGFFLEDTSPESIANRIIDVLDYPYMERITKNALDFINEEFNYQSAVIRYDCILKEVLK